MRRLLFLSIPLFFLVQVNAQKGARFSYLVVKLETEIDRLNSRSFIRLLPDPDNPHAQSLYGLSPYVNSIWAVNKSANFYPQVKDTTQPFYNYFLNQSQVLQFVTNEGWELVEIGQDITSILNLEWDNGEKRYYSRINAQPVLYLRKPLE